MINPSLDGLKLVAESRNIRNHENKSKRDLIKVLCEPKPKMGINKKKLEEIRKDFNELRHNFSKKERDEYRKSFYDIKNYRFYRKSFYDIKNYRYLSTSETEDARDNLKELEKSLRFEKW